MNCYDGIGPWGRRVYGYETRYPQHRHERTRDRYPDWDDYSEPDDYSESDDYSEPDSYRDGHRRNVNRGINFEHVSNIHFDGRNVFGGDMRYPRDHQQRRHHRDFYDDEPRRRIRYEETVRRHARGRNGRRHHRRNYPYDLDDGWDDDRPARRWANNEGRRNRWNGWANEAPRRNNRIEGDGRRMRMLTGQEDAPRRSPWGAGNGRRERAHANKRF